MNYFPANRLISLAVVSQLRTARVALGRTAYWALTHLGEPLEPPRVLLARGPPVDWGDLVQTHGAGEFKQDSPDDLPMIDIHHR